MEIVVVLSVESIQAITCGCEISRADRKQREREIRRIEKAAKRRTRA